MIEVNLLPWRKINSQKIKKNYAILFSFIALSALVFVWMGNPMKYFAHEQQVATLQHALPKPVQHAALKNLKYVGYIHQQNIIWGIITLAQEAAQDVQVGMVIPEDDLSVISIDEKKIVLSDSEKKRYVVSKSDA